MGEGGYRLVSLDARSFSISDRGSPEVSYLFRY